MSVWAKILDSMDKPLTAHENIADGDLLFINGDGEAAIADANGSGTYPCVGAANGAATAGNPVDVVVMGWRNDGSALTPGGLQYLSQTAGDATQTAAGTEPQVVGWAASATDWFFFPYPTYNVPN